ncbi:MAG: pentapeptide repeat-containing protein [Clostridia bacterium]
MEQKELDKILEKHLKWLRDEEGGERYVCEFGADLSGANLMGANLMGADLTDANLMGANLMGADLTDANLRGANLTGADLTRADLTRADLSGANLMGADLRSANIDFACWPLWCGSKNVKVDARIATQLAAHFCVLDCDDPAYKAARKAILKFAKTSHRADDLGLLEMEK